jgi:hypothetical protein
VPERVIPVTWNAPRGDKASMYPVDIVIEAADRQGLLRDISEAFSREKVNVTGVQTQSLRDHHGDSARMTFTVEVGDARRCSACSPLWSRSPACAERAGADPACAGPVKGQRQRSGGKSAIQFIEFMGATMSPNDSGA